MPSYDVRNPATGMWHSFDFDQDPSEEDIDEIANMLATQVDTGQSELSSAGAAFGRGVASVPSGIVGGLGAGLGVVGYEDNPLSRAGDAMDQLTEDVLPINPRYAENTSVEVAGVLGQATGQIATIPVGGLAGRGLAGLKGLEGVARAAQVSRAAQQAALGTGFALGADAGRETAERLGIDNWLQRSLMVLGSAGIEGGTEMLGGFGSREFTEGVLGRIPGFLQNGNAATMALGEGAEELLAGAGQPVLERAVLLDDEAPSGAELTPLPLSSREAFTDWLKQGAYGAVAGGYMSGINAITSQPDGRQALQWITQAEFRAKEIENNPAPTPEEAAELGEIRSKQAQAKDWIDRNSQELMGSVEEVLNPQSETRTQWSNEIADEPDPAIQQQMIERNNAAIAKALEIAQANDESPIASPNVIDAIVEEVATPPPVEQAEAIETVASAPEVAETQAAIDSVAEVVPGVAQELQTALDAKVSEGATELDTGTFQTVEDSIAQAIAAQQQLDVMAAERRARSPSNPIEGQMQDLEDLATVMQEEKGRARTRLQNEMRRRIAQVEDQAALNQVVEQERVRASDRDAVNQPSGHTDFEAQVSSITGADLKLTDNPDGSLMLDRIFVDEANRRAGSGSAAISAVKDYADSLGKDVYLLPVEIADTSLDQLNSFYEKNGFEAWDRGVNQWGRPRQSGYVYKANSRNNPTEVQNEPQIEEAWLNSQEFLDAEEAAMQGDVELAEEIESSFRENFTSNEQGQQTSQLETGTQVVEPGNTEAVASQSGEVLPEQDVSVLPEQQDSQAQEEALVEDPAFLRVRDYANSLVALFPSIPNKPSIVSVDQAIIDYNNIIDNGKKRSLADNILLGIRASSLVRMKRGTRAGSYSPEENKIILADDYAPSVAAHEVGHWLQYQVFNNLEEEAKSQIIQEHAEWFKKTFGNGNAPSVADEFATIHLVSENDWNRLSDPVINRSAEHEAYYSSFEEWFADEVSRWATTSEKPLTLVERFFTDIAAKIRRLWDAVRQHFSPSVTMSDWLDSLVGDTPIEVGQSQEITISETQQEEPTPFSPEELRASIAQEIEQSRERLGRLKDSKDWMNKQSTPVFDEIMQEIEGRKATDPRWERAKALSEQAVAENPEGVYSFRQDAHNDILIDVVESRKGKPKKRVRKKSTPVAAPVVEEAVQEPEPEPVADRSAEYEANLRREAEGIPSWTEEKIQQSVDWYRNGQQGDIPFGRPVVMRSIPGAVEEQDRKNAEAERLRKQREGKRYSAYSSSPSADASIADNGSNRPTQVDAIEAMEILNRSKAGRLVANSAFIARNVEDYNRQNPDAPINAGSIQALEGMYIKSTGEVVVFLDNIVPKEGETLPKAVARVAVHERVFHGGVQWMYNNSPEFARKMDAVAAKIPQSEKQPIIDRYVAAGVPAKNISIVEEWMAQKLQGETVDKLAQGDSLFREIWQAFKDFVARVLGLSPNSVAVENEARSLIEDVLKSPSALLGEPTMRVPDREVQDYSIASQSFSRQQRQEQLDQLMAQGAPREAISFHDFLGAQTDQAKLTQSIAPMAADFRSQYWTGGVDENGQPLVNDENVRRLEQLNDSSLDPNWGDRMREGFVERAQSSEDPAVQLNKGDVYGGVALMEMANMAQLAMASGHPLGPQLVARAERYAHDVLISSYLSYSNAGRLLNLASLASRASSGGLNFWKGLKERKAQIAKDISNKVGTDNANNLADSAESVDADDVDATPELNNANTEIQRYSGQQYLNDNLMDWVKEEDEKPFSSFRSAIEQDGVERMVDAFFRGGSQPPAPGPLVQGSDMINKTMTELMNDALDTLGIARATGRKSPTAAERIIRELGLNDVREGKMREFGIALEAKIAEVAEGNPEFTKQLMDQWEFLSSFWKDSQVPGSTSRRVIYDVLKLRAEQNLIGVPPGVAPPKIVKSINDLAKLTPDQQLIESQKILDEVRDQLTKASSMEMLDGTTSTIDPNQLDSSMRSIKRVLEAMVGNAQNQMAKNAEDNAVRSAGIKPLINYILQQPYQYQNDQKKMGDLLREWLVANAGFSPTDAATFAGKYTPAFRAALNEARAKAVERVAKRIKSLKKKTLDDIIQAVRVGMSDPSGDIHKMIAESLGYKPFTPAALQKMAEIDLKTRDVSPTELAIEKKKLKDTLAEFSPPMTKFNRTYQSFVYSVLSGMGTLGLGFTVPAYASLVRMGSTGAGIVSDVATGKIDKSQGADAIGAMFGDYVDAYKNWVADFQHHWVNDRMSMYHIQSVQDLNGMQEDMKRSIEQFKNGNPAQKVTAAIKLAQASTDIVRKIMNSSDGAAARLFQNILIRKGARDLLMQGDDGMKVGEIGDQIAAATEAGRKAAQAFLLKNPNAKSYDAQQVAMDASNQSILQFLNDRLGPDAKEQVEKYAENEARLEIGTIDREKGAMWDVPHFIAEVVKNASAFAGEQNPLLGRMLLGFVSIPVNLANRSLAFTPWGLVRSAIKQYEVNKGVDEKLYMSSMGTQMQLRQRWVEGVAGSAALLVLSALAFAGGDDDERTYTGLRITLNGPEDKNLRDAWMKRGNRPNSISFVVDGKPVFSLNFNRGGPEVLKMPLIAVGAINDMKLNGKLQNTSLIDQMAGWAQASFRGGAEASSFFGLKNMAQVPSMFDARGSSDTNIASNIAWMGSGFIPWSGLAKNITRATDGQLDQSSVYAAIIAQTPVVNAILGQPALNFLGDQKGSAPVDLAGSITNATAVSGMPFYTSTGKDGENAALYALMIKNGDTPSMPSRSRLEAKNGYLPEEKWGNFVKLRGGLIKKEMRARLKELRAMDKTQFEKAMSDMSTNATTEAKKRLRLK